MSVQSVQKKSLASALLLVGLLAFGTWTYSAHSEEPPVPVSAVSGEGDRIALEPNRRDTTRMSDEQIEFFEDLQKTTESDYQRIYRSLPGVTYIQWKAMTRKALNVFHRMTEYKKAMGLYSAGLKRASMASAIAGFIITPAIVWAYTGNFFAGVGSMAIPWEAPFVMPLWMTGEIAAQRLWLRWQLNWADLGELEDLRQKILNVDPDNRVFAAIFETASLDEVNYNFNAVKKLQTKDGRVLATNSITVEELEDIVRKAKNGDKFLYELSAKRGPYREYAAILLRIIDVDDGARTSLKELLQKRVSPQKYPEFRPQFAALETVRAQLNSVSREILTRLQNLQKSFPLGLRSADLRSLIQEETASTQNLFKEMLKHEYTFLLSIDAGEKPNIDPVLKDLQEMLIFRQKFLAQVDLPLQDIEDKREFIGRLIAWRKKNVLSMKTTCKKLLLGPKLEEMIDSYRKSLWNTF